MDDKTNKRLIEDTLQLLHLTPQEAEHLKLVIEKAYTQGYLDGAKKIGKIWAEKEKI